MFFIIKFNIQIIQDLPRFIKIEEDTSYTPPGQSHATTCIPAGTKLEVKRAFSIEKNWYIECQSETLNIYRFSEDFPLNCTCVDDPEDHTFLNITKKSILLPKKVRFLTISSTDVLTSDAKEATTLLKLIGGPIKILETDVRRKVFIAWLKRCDRNEQSVALIPSNIWKTQTIELKTFTSDLERQDYIRHNFGEHNEFSFVVNGLYTMCPKATDVVWIKAPYTYTSGNSATGRAVNYENTDDDDTEYVKLWTDSPVIPPRPKSFRNPSVPHVTKGRTVHVEQNAVKGREPHPGRSPKAQHENISAKEKSKKGLDNIDTYYNIEGKAYHSLKETTAVGHEVEQDLKSATLPDLRKSSEENQTEEDFYSYSVEELVECFKLCGMNKLAIDCSANKLDGAFFREFNVDDLLSEPFCLNKFQVSKVKMIIENGWRPKSDLPK
ncbi:uncharacterized protein LOC132738130 isoform X2 [Ruditapes philippinarum]|uniref:uncharacterized protein LOC132738130 isoform X2 n=1 Tax=Ruditapes philippinarum TaxID=129788 RepID=UPI00295AF9BD|nr:uncharacterized protein LOC132738130 isoform X2 [Ruditapes philippinarum]